jgi:hypothetical protein
MTTPPNQPIPPMVRTLADNMGFPALRVAHNCHAVSVALVQSGLAGPDARVARGFAKGVGIGQHSWVIVGDPYDMDAHIIDATLWSYDDSVPDVWQGTMRDGIHHPHGQGHFMRGNPPQHHGDFTVLLTPSVPLSAKANGFLRTIGAPFDLRGWNEVAHLPVEGWPAAEIIAAMDDTPTLKALIPIDILAHLTDRNPDYYYRPALTQDRIET